MMISARVMGFVPKFNYILQAVTTKGGGRIALAVTLPKDASARNHTDMVVIIGVNYNALRKE